MLSANKVIFLIMISLTAFVYARPLRERFNQQRPIECLRQLGWVRNGEYITHGNQRLEIIEYDDKDENSGHWYTITEIKMKNSQGDLMKVVRIWPEKCYLKIVQCSHFDYNCEPGSAYKWRSSAWLSIPEPPSCPINLQNQIMLTNGKTNRSLQEQKHLAKRAPTRAKCFLKDAQNNKDPKPCGTGEDSGLLSLQELSQRPAQYSEVEVDNEADLILSRGDGLFDWNELDLSEKFICKKHYKNLGPEWNRKRPFIGDKKGKSRSPKCLMPTIQGTISHTKAAKAD